MVVKRFPMSDELGCEAVYVLHLIASVNTKFYTGFGHANAVVMAQHFLKEHGLTAVFEDETQVGEDQPNEGEKL